ncbi:uncharacterized protein LOC141671630 [Apium graveolens]|uniref:uncharacterized protein LOC141671630 n=1 Tax=Apium graveolens TaxID=4045 RepID=UPI003D799CE1
MAPIRRNLTLSEDLTSEIQLRHAITTQTDQIFINSVYVSKREHIFALLNVDSRQIVAYPKVPCFRVLGFGYDEVDHDFKVVRLVEVEKLNSFYAKVYSTNRNEWRKVADPIDLPTCYFDVCFNGFLCGTSCHEGDGIIPRIEEYRMVAFDLNKEVLNCAIRLPFVCDDDHIKPRIIKFNTSIVVIVLMDDMLNRNSKIKMWMLDDDACLGGLGVEATWTPMFITSTIAMPSYIVKRP